MISKGTSQKKCYKLSKQRNALIYVVQNKFSKKHTMPREGNPLVVSRVIGDVLDPFIPTTDLQVSYDGRVICDASRLRPSQVAARPRVGIGGLTDSETFYTLVMVDADAPSPGNAYMREYLHWLVTNIPGGTGTSSGNEIVCYEAPQPSMGIHRLVVALFQQPGRVHMNPPEWRQNFSIREFSRVFNLDSPVAALYYNCHRETGTGGRRPRHE